jgi:DNA repair exonuclease SbcCD ATPase subunit
VLYLAEVKKQSKGFMGGSETKLKLLAFQRQDRSWAAVSGEESIAAEEATIFNEGALVFCELTMNRQIQGELEPAAGKLINILQHFSRLLEKSKKQEEEIEQWRESLTYQSEELSRREMEMDSRIEQFEQMGSELEQLESDRQEVDRNRETISQLREELERKQQELEGAWEQLRGEQQSLQNQKAQSLDREQITRLEAIIQALTASIPTGEVAANVDLGLQAVNQQQECLQKYWQDFETQKKLWQQKQTEANSQEEAFKAIEGEWQSLKQALDHSKTQLQVQQKVLSSKQKLLQVIQEQYQHQEDLKDSIARLGVASGDGAQDRKVDLQALENMPLGELQGIVQNLQTDLEKVVNFVNEQEEELTWQGKAVEELQEKLTLASEYDRIDLETELAEEQERKSMLDEALLGQRRSLRERQEVLLQHIRVLRRRQGILDTEVENMKVTLDPILLRLKRESAQMEEKKQKFSLEVEQLQAEIIRLQETIEQQNSTCEAKLTQSQSQEAAWRQSQQELNSLQAKVKAYEEVLQPIQDAFDRVRNHLEGLSSLQAKLDGANSPQQAIVDLQQIVTNWSNAPEMATA